MSKIIVKDTEINVFRIHEDDYLCLTDMLKAKDGDFLITDRFRNRNTYAHKDIAFEFAMWISPEFNICLCKCLVADLTSQNTGVYYEAGYAKAIGKTVILTCKEADFENVHFDIKQTQIVKWSEKENLEEKMHNHILKTFSK